MFYCRPKSFEYPNLPKFQFVKSQKLSDYMFQNLQKITSKIKVPLNKDFLKITKLMSQH